MVKKGYLTPFSVQEFRQSAPDSPYQEEIWFLISNQHRVENDSDRDPKLEKTFKADKKEDANWLVEQLNKINPNI